MSYDPNDWRLTAYVLGELDEKERADVEAMLAESEEARRAVEEIRRTTGLVEDELQKEPVLALTGEQRKAIEDKAAQMNGRGGIPATSSRSFWSRFGVPMSLAASVLILLGIGYGVLPSLVRNGLSPVERVAIDKSAIMAQDDAVELGERTRPDPAVPDEAKDSDAPGLEEDYGSSRADCSSMPDSDAFCDDGLTCTGVETCDTGTGECIPGTPPCQAYQTCEEPEGTCIDPDPSFTFSAMRSASGGSEIRLMPVTSTGDVVRMPGLDNSGPTKTSIADGDASEIEHFGAEVISPIQLASVVRAPKGEVGAPAVRPKHTFAYDSEYDGSPEYSEDRYAHDSGDHSDRRLLQTQHRRRMQMRRQNTEAYDHIVHNPFLEVVQNPLSTFSIDVDTASYSNIRRFLKRGMMPPAGAVRIEEMINYFAYDYPQPDGDAPFSVNVEIGECPWKPNHRLARIGLRGFEVDADDRVAGNFVFLLDVSGSMQPANKLPLVRRAMRMLLEELSPEDYVAIVVYAGASGLVLPSTSCADKDTILDALESLNAGGSTNGAQGIQLAYDVAVDNFIPGGINRVILATDGDFNVGVTNQGDLIRLIEEKAASGVFLSVLGFGMGNYKDSTLEKLADKGNGNYAYIDTLNEARKVLVDQLSGTLVTIAKDVKIQIEFNPAEVAAYRLIGYENRILAAEDFNDDTKDAGEIGAGHTVTALYEIVPAGEPVDRPAVDPLKYQAVPAETRHAYTGETMTVKLRYKEPDGDTSELLEYPITDEGWTFADASDDFVFAASVASFGMLLRDSPHKGSSTFEAVVELAEQSVGEDVHGYRAEFINLVRRAITAQDAARSQRSQYEDARMGPFPAN
ncbi:MAG: von Willebrand factor type A domain-containing protein [Phycisphaerales bacterium]|nr:MAG: von Willebrand factor type A domain-containing protein [Phycisphaerales bacterium]